MLRVRLRLRLSDADRDRLGGPEWVEFDGTRLMVEEARLLRRYTGRSFKELGDALVEGGDEEAIAAMVWLARRRAGVDEKFSGLDFDMEGVEREDIPPDPTEGQEAP